MSNATQTPCYQYQVGDLAIYELRSIPHGRTWAVQPEDGYILITAGMSEWDRRRVLAAAFAELVAAEAQS